MSRQSVGMVVALLVLMSCAQDPIATPLPSTTTIPPTTSPTAVRTTTTSGPAACEPRLLNPPDSPLDFAIEAVSAAYNLRNPDRIAAIVGDGPVFDPMLDPTDGVITYPDVASWVAAGDRVVDRFALLGYTVGSEPVAFHAGRSSALLASVGVEGVGVTVRVFVQECEYRIVVGPQLVSGDDGCLLYSLFGNDTDVPPPDECSTKLARVGRAGHVAVWSGEEMIVWGGTRSLLSNQNLRSGVAFDPDTSTWRRIADLDAGADELPGYGSHAVWTGSEMLVFGGTAAGLLHGYAYDPSADSWRRISPIPNEERNYVGAFAWTGEELILWGGDQNYAADDGWSYRPASDTWRPLPASIKPPTEAAEGVWTGDEVIIWGGYPYADSYGVAYDTETKAWKEIGVEPAIYEVPAQAVENHVVIWTGEEMLIWGGNGGPRHTPYLIGYDPASDQWYERASAPVAGRERFPAVWTGQQFVVWGGYETYGPIPDIESLAAGDGAVYEPASDTWTLMSPSPLDDRCDHTGVWTGTTVIYFGGYEQCGSIDDFIFGTGASYDPATDSWQLLPPPPA